MATQTANGVLEDFRLEFLRCWRLLPNKSSFILLTIAWVALFAIVGNSTLGYYNTPSLFGYMYNAFSTGGNSILEAEEGYSFLVPIVVLVLLWNRRSELVSLELHSWWPGLLMLATAIFLHVLGYSIQQPRLSVVAFFIGLYGIMGLAWGRTWLRATAFPFFLFCFCVPIGSMADPVTFRLRLLVSQLVGLICHYILAIDVVVQGNLLLDPTGHYQYEVAAACSGIRSLIATLAFSVILAFVSFHNSWKRLLLIASSVPLAVLGNLFRMLAIIMAAEWGGQKCGDYIHEGGPLGIISLLPYIPAFVGLLTIDHYLKTAPGHDRLSSVQSLKLKET